MLKKIEIYVGGTVLGIALCKQGVILLNDWQETIYRIRLHDRGDHCAEDCESAAKNYFRHRHGCRKCSHTHFYIGAPV